MVQFENIWANVFGTITCVLWTIQLFPQIWHSYRRKSTDGLSVGLMALWFLAGVFLAPYTIYVNLSVPLIIQPHTLITLCIICILQNYWYQRSRPVSLSNVEHFDKEKKQEECVSIELSCENKVEKGDEMPPLLPFKRRLLNCMLTLAITLTVWASVEVGLLLWLNNTKSDILLTSIAIISGVATLAGFAPQYITMFKLKTAAGLALFFPVLDALGAVSGIVSLIFSATASQKSFDLLTAILYGCVFLGNFGMVIVKLVVYKD